MTILRCKVAIVGDIQTGKSALTQTFHNNGKQFPKQYVMTLGVDFCMKAVKIPDTDVSVELYLFDTSGSEIFAKQRTKFWEGSSMFLFVYDVANPQSFSNLRKWLQLVKAAKPDQKIRGAVVAMKSDLQEYSEIKLETAERFAEENSLAFFSCSALEGKEVDTPFNFIAASFETLYREKTNELQE